MNENLKSQVRSFDETLSAFDVMADEFQLPMIKEHIEKKTDFEAIQKAVNEYVAERNSLGENIKKIRVSPSPGATPEQVIESLRKCDEFQKYFNSIPKDFRYKIEKNILRDKIKQIQKMSHSGYPRIIDGDLKTPSYEDMQKTLMDIWSICEGIYLNSTFAGEITKEWKKENGK